MANATAAQERRSLQHRVPLQSQLSGMLNATASHNFDSATEVASNHNRTPIPSDHKGMRYLEKLNERQKRMEQKYFKKDAQSTTSEAHSHISATTATKQRLKLQRGEHQSANVTN